MEEDEIGGACSVHGVHEKCVQDFGWKPEGKRPLHSIDVDGRIILKPILRKQLVRGFIRLRIGTSAGFCEHGNGG
jgi:hypothetical protein